MDELTREFLAESLEGLERMESRLAALRATPGDAAALAEIFRVVHTIKGSTGFLAFSRLEKLAHAGEWLLARMRDGSLAMGDEVMATLLRLHDGLRAIVLLIERTGQEGGRAEDDDAALIAAIHSVMGGSSSEEPALAVSSRVVERDQAWSANGEGARRTIRVDAEILDELLHLAAELVLVRNRVRQALEEEGRAGEASGQLDALTTALRDTVMQARTQPVQVLLGGVPSMVRELERVCGKRVRVVMEGEETRLDKAMLDALRDPLIHTLRNAVDHGVEAVTERMRMGKNVEGVITVRAYQDRESVVVEVRDDGAGICVERVRSAAVERGVLPAEKAASLSEQEVLQLIFEPGFSTAREITEISGRGVGMDAVRASLRAAGGSVEVRSCVGAGTTVEMRVPLTLAIVAALTIRTGGQTFCLPQPCVRELHCLTWRELMQVTERVGAKEYLRVRETLLPAVRLDTILELAPCEAERKRGMYAAVLQTWEGDYALLFDDLLGPEEVVVKSLPTGAGLCGVYAGVTLRGSGEVAFILDGAGVAGKANIVCRKGGDAMPNMPAGEAAEYVLAEEKCNDRRQRLAVPAWMVRSVEEHSHEAFVQLNGAWYLRGEDGRTVPMDARWTGPHGGDAVVMMCEGPRAGSLYGVAVDRLLGMCGEETLLKQGPVLRAHAITGRTGVAWEIAECAVLAEAA